MTPPAFCWQSELANASSKYSLSWGTPQVESRIPKAFTGGEMKDSPCVV